MSAAKTVLDGNDVPEENRWFVAPPAFYQQLRKAGAKIVDQSVMARRISFSYEKWYGYRQTFIWF
jgi:hypothetical protein